MWIIKLKCALKFFQMKKYVCLKCRLSSLNPYTNSSTLFAFLVQTFRIYCNVYLKQSNYSSSSDFLSQLQLIRCSCCLYFVVHFLLFPSKVYVCSHIFSYVPAISNFLCTDMFTSSKESFSISLFVLGFSILDYTKKIFCRNSFPT